MKKLIFTAALLFSCITFQIANAQIRFHVNLNIGNQPDWGPVGYDHVDYYYMPDVDAYYDVSTHQYTYFENNIWVHRTYLPARYRGYDVYHGYKVVVNRPNPWLRHAYYHNTYASYRGRGGQAIIRDSHDARYRNHWNGNRGGGPGHEFHGGGPGRDYGHHDNDNHGGGPGHENHGGGPGHENHGGGPGHENHGGGPGHENHGGGQGHENHGGGDHGHH